MAAEDLHALSSMLKVQLPFLFSFAVMRWVLGVVLGGIGGWVVRRIGYARHLPLIVSVLSHTRAFVYLAALAGLSGAWLQEWSSHGASSACGPNACVRVQGASAGIGMMVLLTNGSPLALGMALATLKAVADTSASSTMLSSMAILFAVRHGHEVRAFVLITSIALMSFLFGCWRGRYGQKYTEGPVLGLLVLAVYVLARASALLTFLAIRSGTKATRATLRVPLRVCVWVLKGRRAL